MCVLPQAGRERASPIPLVTLSQLQCLTSYFSGKAAVGVFLFTPFLFLCSLDLEKAGERTTKRKE